jgi:hypothetical protein
MTPNNQGLVHSVDLVQSTHGRCGMRNGDRNAFEAFGQIVDNHLAQVHSRRLVTNGNLVDDLITTADQEPDLLGSVREICND